MYVTLEIPDEFAPHYLKDRFVDSLRRIKCDLAGADLVVCGRYEKETLDMLIHAFDCSMEADEKLRFAREEIELAREEIELANEIIWILGMKLDNPDFPEMEDVWEDDWEDD